MNLLLLGKAISAQDIIKKSILKLMPTTIDPLVLIMVLLVALIVGLGIFMVYRKYFIGVVYDHSFNISLVVILRYHLVWWVLFLLFVTVLL